MDSLLQDPLLNSRIVVTKTQVVVQGREAMSLTRFFHFIELCHSESVIFDGAPRVVAKKNVGRTRLPFETNTPIKSPLGSTGTLLMMLFAPDENQTELDVTLREGTLKANKPLSLHCVGIVQTPPRRLAR
jgi:hypothetical protein